MFCRFSDLMGACKSRPQPQAQPTTEPIPAVKSASVKEVVEVEEPVTKEVDDEVQLDDAFMTFTTTGIVRFPFFSLMSITFVSLLRVYIHQNYQHKNTKMRLRELRPILGLAFIYPRNF